ncbi:MAG: thioredoxin family protein [Verrucomicrobiaceae bacterium]|nr:thioredoxin family protein [Verrucomicrobiaceae bacterium]
MRFLLTLIALMLTTAALAAPFPFDENANAKADIQQTLLNAQTAKLPVLIIFGANWCPDCRALDASIKTEKNAELIAKTFRIVKVDIGNFDRNLDIAAAYGDPQKNGIPAAVIVSPNNDVLYTSRRGDISSARRMSDTAIYEYFRDAAATANNTNGAAKQ